jgi:hypothetical protein
MPKTKKPEFPILLTFDQLVALRDQLEAVAQRCNGELLNAVLDKTRAAIATLAHNKADGGTLTR